MSSTAPEAGKSDAAHSKARLRLWLRLLKASRAVEAELRERLRVEHATTLPRFDVLAALHRAEKGLKMSELSGVLRVSNGNVTGIVDRLVQDGLIMRVPVEDDRRAMRVRLTQRGREVFQKKARDHETWVNELLGMIDPREAEQMMTALERIARHGREEEKP